MKIRIQIEDVETPEGPGVSVGFEFDPPPSAENVELMSHSLAAKIGAAAGATISNMISLAEMLSRHQVSQENSVQDLTPPT